MNGLGEQLRKARMAAGMKQLNAAMKIGVENSTISGWERDRTEPGIDVLYKMADVYGTTVMHLLQPLNPENSNVLEEIHRIGKQLSETSNTDQVIRLCERLKYLPCELLEEKKQEHIRAMTSEV